MTEGCIPPLSDLLEVHDAKIVTVALEGLENILKVRRAGATCNLQGRLERCWQELALC